MREMTMAERQALLSANPAAVSGTVRVRLDDLIFGDRPTDFLDHLAAEVTGVGVNAVGAASQVAFVVVGHEPDNILVLSVTVVP